MTLVDYTALVPRRHDLWVDVDHNDAMPYAIRDGANRNEVIVRSRSLENLLAWAEAFCAREGATLDLDSVEVALGAAALKAAFADTFGHSVKVPKLRVVGS